VTGFRYDKAAARDMVKGPGLPPGDGSPDVTLAEVERLTAPPGSRPCRRCERRFVTTGEEPHPLPIRLCPSCRLDAEEEGALNGLAQTLSDDGLLTAPKQIAVFESRIARAEGEAERAALAERPRQARVRRRRAERLQTRLAQIKAVAA